MENVEILENKIIKNNQGEFSSDIFDNISKNIDVEKLIDDGILKISDDVREYIDSIGYTIEDVLKLARMYNNYDDLKDITIDFNDLGRGFDVKIFGKLFSIDTTIHTDTGFVHNNSINTMLSNVSGFKATVTQIKIAKEKGYTYIKGFAGVGSRLSGYYYWPTLGFRAVPDLEISDLYKYSANNDIRNCKTLNQLFDLQDNNGEYIGIEFWKKYGEGFGVKFDLTEGSKSIKRLNEYIVSKKQSNPEKYSDIDVIK